MAHSRSRAGMEKISPQAEMTWFPLSEEAGKKFPRAEMEWSCPRIAPGPFLTYQQVRPFLRRQTTWVHSSCLPHGWKRETIHSTDTHSIRPDYILIEKNRIIVQKSIYSSGDSSLSHLKWSSKKTTHFTRLLNRDQLKVGPKNKGCLKILYTLQVGTNRDTFFS